MIKDCPKNKEFLDGAYKIILRNYHLKNVFINLNLQGNHLFI